MRADALRIHTEALAARNASPDSGNNVHNLQLATRLSGMRINRMYPVCNWLRCVDNDHRRSLDQVLRHRDEAQAVDPTQTGLLPASLTCSGDPAARADQQGVTSTRSGVRPNSKLALLAIESDIARQTEALQYEKAEKRQSWPGSWSPS